MRSTLVTAPTLELISMSEAKEFLRVTHTHEDALIAQLCKSVIVKCQSFCRMAFTSQTWDVEVDIPKVRREILLGPQAVVDPDDVLQYLKLPKRPVQSVTSVIAFKISDGTTLTADPANYTYRDCRLYWKDVFWPAVSGYDLLTIRYVVGCASADAFKATYPDLWEALLIALREAYDRGENSGLPKSARDILSQYWNSPTY